MGAKPEKKEIFMRHKLGIVALICCAVLFMTASVFMFAACEETEEDTTANLTVTATQVENEQKVNVGFETDFVYDSVTVSVIHDGTVSYKHTYKSADVSETPLQVPAFYGKQTIKVQLKKGKAVCTRQKEVPVFAQVYNIAPLTATMPVTMFSLSLPEITENYTIPTFVWFKRSEAWNYDNMPENVYTVPVASLRQIKGNSNQKTIYKMTNAWIKELYDINPSSHFNLFYNDYFGYGWLDATVARGIPTENYTVSLLSDGTASFHYFNKRLNNKNYESTYAKMKADYETLKTEIAAQGSYIERGSYIISAEGAREYAFVMAKEEPNLTWWLTRANGTLGTEKVDGDVTVYNKIVSELEGTKILIKDLKKLYSNLSEENCEMIRKLYDFGGSLLTEAVTQNKKPMILLGTWAYSEDRFADYVKATRAFYGTEKYVYYYKGHPKSPTNSVPGKLEQLEALGLIDVDSTISAELFFFTYPPCVGSGYQSSTFLSTTDEQTGAIWGVRKGKVGQSYEPNLDAFISPLDHFDTTYGKYLDSEALDRYMLVEFRDTSVYDFGIYDNTTETIVYYKNGVKAD